ncbi:MAG: carboxypeptidase-like regulatory domain-containing protein, partial [Bacteroidia bacterium]
MHKIIKYNLLFKALLIVMLFFSFSQKGISQNTKVSGKIIDAVTREPLPFVNIIFKGTIVGAATDIEGRYSLSTAQNVDSIIVSYIGYNRAARAVKKGA